MRPGACLALCAVAAFAGACGGGAGGGGGGGGVCTPGTTAAVTIKSGGVSPAAVCVLPGGSVTFTNADTVQHDIESGTCAELNLGVIPAGQGKTATFPVAETCPFHDALNPTSMAFQGTVAVTTAPAPGY